METLHIEIEKTNKIIPIPVKNIRVAFNIRYGWEKGKILDAYKSGIDELVNSIKTWGFKPNEPLEVYDSGEVDEEGNPIYDLGEGHRRFESVQCILSEDPDYNFGNGLANGEVWGFISPKPESILDLLASQFDANKSAKNTRLDTAKAIFTAIESGELKGNKKTIYPEIGKRIAGLTSYQSVDSFYMTYQLPDEVKDWIQESELNEDLQIALSFSTAAEIVTYYKVEDASKLLSEALHRMESQPEKVDTFGNKVTKAWLHSLAVELKLGKKPPKTKAEVSSQVVSTTPESSQSIEQVEASASTDIHPVTPTTLISESVEPASTTPSDKNPVSDEIGFSESAVSTAVLPKEKPTAKVEPKSSEDRVKTLILKTLSEKAGEYIVNGKSDVDSGVFIVEFPQDIGEDLAELISSFIDPKSNPPEQITSFSSVVDEMEF